MSDNKFIKHLRGTPTAGSVLEIKNQNTTTSFGKMPQGTSNAIDVFSDHRGNATAVLNGTTNWKISNSNLILANDVTGDGADFSSTYSVSGAGLWIDSVYTFPSTGDPAHPVAMVFNPSTKWVLKVCGDNLIVDGGYIVDFTLLVKIGTYNVFTKTFSVAEQAGPFCKEFVLDFNETNTGIVKASGLSTLTVQLLCGTANASARIYNGMTVLTCLQRKVDASAVSNSFANVEEALQDGMLPSDYFNNAAFIDQVEDGDKAYAVFQRDGDEINLAGWDEPIPSQTGNSGKYLTTDGSDMSWHQITASDVGALPDSTKYGASFSLSMNSSNFVITAQLKDQDGNNLGSAQTIDLPLESVVVNGSYDNVTKSLILTLENGNTITIPIADLISGLQEEITVDNKLDADLVDDSTSTNKFVTASDITNWNGHIVNTNNPHSVTKAQVGLGNADNTSDLDKPISTATQTALDGKQDTISDLSTIRSNAQAGKAASDTIATYGDIVTHNVAEFATAAQGAKADTAVQPEDLATVATSGSYNDLSDKPTIPAAQVNADWNAASGVAKILNKPTLGTAAAANTTDFATAAQGSKADTAVQPSDLATVATSGSYNDLSNKPTIPTVNNATLTIQKNGTTVQTFTANQSTNATANISVPTKTSDITNDSGFITSSALAPYVLSADLATVATSGDYDDLSNKPTIPTVGNGTITITQGGISKGTFTTNQSGNTTIALDAGGGGIGNIDNITITANADDEIQAVATINANTATGATNPIYDWVGTLAEYQAQNIETLHPDWVCYVTDDFSAQAYDAYSKGQSDNLFVTKGHQVIEFQEPTAANNYTWYRKYSDGWVEQGGIIAQASSADVNINFPVIMSDTNYGWVLSIAYNNTTSAVYRIISAWNFTTTGMTARCDTNFKKYWRVEGMAA